MVSIAELTTELKERWGDNPSAGLSIAIIEHLASLPAQELRMLTFYSLANALNQKAIDERLVRAVLLLTNTSIHALDTRLLFIDDDGEEFEIELAELEEARAEGAFPHPNTGTLVSNYEAKVFPYFVPSKRLLEARSTA